MKQFSQYKNGEFSERELDNFTGKIIRAKFRKEKKNKWTQQLEKDHGVTRSESNLTTLRRNYFGKYIMAIAASLLFVIIAFFIIQGNSSLNAVQYADNYLEENRFPNSIATKGSFDIPLLELKMAEEYNQGRFSEAIATGKQLIDIAPSRSNNYFFLGLSYLYTDDLENAKMSLLEFRKGKTVEFNQESRWFLALTYTKLKDFDRAKAELQHIINQKEWNHKKAEELIGKIQ